MPCNLVTVMLVTQQSTVPPLTDANIHTNMTQTSTKIKHFIPYIYNLEPARLVFNNVNNRLEQVLAVTPLPRPLGYQAYKLN